MIKKMLSNQVSNLPEGLIVSLLYLFRESTDDQLDRIHTKIRSSEELSDYEYHIHGLEDIEETVKNNTDPKTYVDEVKIDFFNSHDYKSQRQWGFSKYKRIVIEKNI